MFQIVLFVLFSVCSTTPTCQEHQFVGSLDCSGLMLSDIGRLPVMGNSWVILLDLWMNCFVSVNFTNLAWLYPNLQIVDVRDNPTFDCRFSRGLRILIRSDCKVGSSTISTSEPSLLPFTTTRTDHGMSFSSTVSSSFSSTISTSDPSLLPFTSTRTDHGMSFFSTVLAKRFSHVRTSIQNRATTPIRVGKDLELSFLLIVTIGPSAGLVIMLIGTIYLCPQNVSASTEKA